MSPDAMFFIELATKMAVTAAFVVAATAVAERSGPFLGGFVATLPISAGPVYLFLALDHDASFIAASALASLAANAVTGLFALVYILVAQVRGPLVSLLVTLGFWALAIFTVRSFVWTLPGALMLNAASYAVAVPVARRFRSAQFPPPRRRWYDVPLRAGLVAVLVATVVGLSTRVGPALTGMLAVFPVVLTSLILIFHPRIGGPPTAAILANTLPGLVGFAAALLALHLATVPLGKTAALILALAVSIVWNLTLWANRSYPLPLWERVARRRSRRAG
jgi:hypothetical protein